MNILCEVVQHIMRHMDPVETNKLMRTNKLLRDSIKPYEEWYWSGSRMVKVMRQGTLKKGKLQMMWIRDSFPIMFELEPMSSAREILETLWALKKTRNEERWSLFVDCTVWPDLIGVPIPCYLFKTDAAVRHVSGKYCVPMTYSLDGGWPVWISCEDHPYRRCVTCRPEDRFRVGTRFRPEILFRSEMDFV